MYRPGDVLMYKSPGFKFSNILAKLIQLCTGNEVIHVALYLGVDGFGRHIILDALISGVLIKTMGNIEHRDDGFELYRVARLPHAVGTEIDYRLAAIPYNGSDYGIITIINLLLQHGYGRLFPKSPWRTWFKSHDAYICSEVCQLVVENVEKIQFPKLANLTEPDDYFGEPWTKAQD